MLDRCCIIKLMKGEHREKAEVLETVVDISHTTRVLLGRHDITVITEKLPYDMNAPRVVSFATNAYEKDRVIYKVRKDFTEDIDIRDASQLQRVIDMLHREALEGIKAGQNIRKEPGAYLKAIKSAGRRNPTKALALAKEAYVMHPDDSMVLSYYGYLLAMVEKKYKSAADFCEKAITLHPRKLPPGLGSTQKPLLYFHLARVYHVSGNRNGAVKTIYRGIGFDVEGGILHRELEKLGVRRRPVIPFLGRNNALNRLFGRLRHRIKGPPEPGTIEEG